MVHHKLVFNERGVIALITAIVLGLFLFSIGSLLTIQSGTSIFSGKFTNQADRAQSLAEAGVQDALVRIARDKNYNGTSTIAETDATVNILVSIIGSTTTVIVSTSTVTQGSESVKRTIRADVLFTASDGVLLSVTKTNL